jgi:hypothetical protein
MVVAVVVAPVRQPLCSLAGRYDNPNIHNKGLRIWPLDTFMGANLFFSIIISIKYQRHTVKIDFLSFSLYQEFRELHIEVITSTCMSLYFFY